MSRILIVRDYERAVAATNFNELWHNLGNDELFELRWIFEGITGRSLTFSFDNATPEDWVLMRRILGHTERVVRRLNSLIKSSDWDNEPLVGSLLARAEIEDREANESPEYLAIANALYRRLRNDFWHGGGGKSFGDHGLFVFQEVPELPALDSRSYDIFISYKTSQHASDAQRLADQLIAKGYSVWFDKYVLDRLESRPQVFETEYLLAILRHAVKKSSCTIIYEGAMHAGALGPGDSEEELEKNHKLMRVNNVPVIWDWHGVEIAATEWGITIHPNTITAFRQEDGKVRWSDKFGYFGESQREKAIDAALSALAIR